MHSRALSVLAITPLLAAGAFAQPCGTPWSVHPGSGPSAREAAAVTYDSARGKVVLFGGRTPSASTIFGDTWEWTAAGPGGGGSWTLVATSGPTTTANAAMAYDSIRQRTVLFGGYTMSGGGTNQTWEWNGTAWALMQPTQSPPAMSPIMSFDPVRGKTVLVSTIYSGPESRATWEYDGTTWTRSSEPTPVTEWYYDSMAFDAARSVMVLYHGGIWERTSQGWQSVSNSSSYGQRILFEGGLNRIASLTDDRFANQFGIWSWNAAAGHWSLMNTGGPPATRHHAIVYDAAGGQLLAFGGSLPSGPLSAATHLARTGVASGPVIADASLSYLSLIYQGAPGSLSISASGNGPLSYQWRRNGVNLTVGGPYSGTQTFQLTVTPLNIAINGWFDAVVTDTCGPTTSPRSWVSVSCYPDCDGVGGLTASDFICFQVAFNNGGTFGDYANCDGSTIEPVLTANDFVCFVQRYVAGCG